ncbi:MAG: hypothetical protein M1814_001530 [Vezdaea aestivalis]|nr:MAG: hypothetical protein M1814_001530 [Vezdaea aestivalis]
MDPKTLLPPEDPGRWQNPQTVVDFLYDRCEEWNRLPFPPKLPPRDSLTAKMIEDDCDGPSFMLEAAAIDLTKTFALNKAQTVSLMTAQTFLRKSSAWYQEYSQWQASSDNQVPRWKRPRQLSLSDESARLQPPASHDQVTHFPAQPPPLSLSNYAFHVPGRAQETVIYTGSGKRRKLNLLDMNQPSLHAVDNPGEALEEPLPNAAGSPSMIASTGLSLVAAENLPPVKPSNLMEDSAIDMGSDHLIQEDSAMSSPEDSPSISERANSRTLTTPTGPTTESGNHSSQPEPLLDSGTTANQLIISEDGKKRLRPMLVAVNLSNRESSSSEEDAATFPAIEHPFKMGYLGRKSLPADIFFFGQQNTNLLSTSSDGANSSDDFAFNTTGAISSGRRRYANSLMRHFMFSTTTILFERNEKQLQGILPYRTTILQKYENGSFLLLASHSNPEEPATIEKVADWPEFATASSIEIVKKPSIGDANPEGDDLVDHILQKYGTIKDSRVLPAYMDSGSEGEYDEATWAEIERDNGKQDMVKDRKLRKQLPSDQVNQIIDSQIEYIAEKWNNRNSRTSEREAYKLWRKKYHRKAFRTVRVDTIKDQLTERRLESLPKVRARILEQPWYHPTDVKRQCGSLESSVEDIEALEWEKSVLELKSCPASPSAGTSKASVVCGKDSRSEESEDSKCEVLFGTFIEDDDDIPGVEMIDDFIDDEADGDDEVESNEADSSEAEQVPLPKLKRNSGSPLRMAETEELLSTPTRPSPTRPSKASGITLVPVVIIPTPPAQRTSSESSPLEPYQAPSTAPDFVRPDPAPKTKQRRLLQLVQAQIPDGSTVECIDLTRSDSNQSSSPRDPQSLAPSFFKQELDVSQVNLVDPLLGVAALGQDVHAFSPLSGSYAKIGDYVIDKSHPEYKPEHDVHNLVCSPNDYPFERYEVQPKDRKGFLLRLLASDEETRRSLAVLIDNFDGDVIKAATQMRVILDRMLSNAKRREANPSKQISLNCIDSRKDRVFVQTLVQWHFCSRESGLSPYKPQLIQQLLTELPRAPSKGTAKFPKEKSRFQVFFRDLEPAVQYYRAYNDQLKIDQESSLRKTQPEVEGADSAPDLALEHVLPGTSQADSSQRRKRKRVVEENLTARRQRDKDADRMSQYQKRVDHFEETTTPSQDRIAINPAKDANQALVYIHHEIARRMKPHQTTGVRFLWREIVHNDETSKGCLLAHTMGLGKTMQVITLLTTLIACVDSADEKLTTQIPKSLHDLRTLILCPPSLIKNWAEEINMWMPKSILERAGQIVPVLPVKPGQTLWDRDDLIQDWATGRGILIIGYELFRRYTSEELPMESSHDTFKTSAKKLSKRQSKERSKNSKENSMRSILLDSPSLVIADEAHKIKNPASKLALRAQQIKTPNRIALTGSPLANNLEEYFCMIDWISKGYLGPIVEFRANYVEPIRDGLYVESSPESRRKCQRKLYTIDQLVRPKVDRAGLDVLRGHLKLKIEFDIQVPLTQSQQDAYTKYTQIVPKDHAHSEESSKKNTSTRLWAQLGNLGLLCAHPLCYNLKLTQKTRQENHNVLKRLVGGSDVGNPTDAAEQNVPDAEAIQETITSFGAGADADEMNLEATGASHKDQLNAFAKLGSDVYSPELSNKYYILDQLVDLCKEADDKLLIFSSSLWVLDFVEGILVAKKCRFMRVDGDVKVQLRQDMCHRFNTKDDLDVALISTKAGGVGINLYGANRVIILDKGFNPINEEQAVGRSYRIGQQKPVFVYYLRSWGTFEDTMHNNVVFKKSLAGRVVDKKTPKRFASSFTAANYIFPPKPAEFKDDGFATYSTEDPDVLGRILANEKNSRRICAIDHAESFQMEQPETLTKEDIEEAKKETAVERLRFENPAEYARRKSEMFMKRAMNTGSFLGTPGRSGLGLPSNPPSATPPVATSAAQYPTPDLSNARSAIQRMLKKSGPPAPVTQVRKSPKPQSPSLASASANPTPSRPVATTESTTPAGSPSKSISATLPIVTRSTPDTNVEAIQSKTPAPEPNNGRNGTSVTLGGSTTVRTPPAQQPPKDNTQVVAKEMASSLDGSNDDVGQKEGSRGQAQPEDWAELRKRYESMGQNLS